MPLNLLPWSWELKYNYFSKVSYNTGMSFFEKLMGLLKYDKI